jgi:hypothetical protein
MIMAKDLIDPRTGRAMAIRRAGSLGQLDSEFNYGPKPLQPRDVPIDIRERYIKHDTGIGAGVGLLPNGAQDLSGLIKDVHSIAGVFVLRRGLLGRVVTITSVPQLIINNQEQGGKGYLLLNPAGVVGLTAQGTVFSSTTLVGATTLASGALGVANYKSGRFFVVATFVAGAGPVTFDLQTLDPVSGTTWITTQTVFSLTATGNVYASVGDLGIDVDARIFVTVPVGTTITFTMGFVLKDGLSGTSAGATQTIFVGQSGVSASSGYPILPGQEKPFYFEENVQLYGVTSGPSLDMNIFEL